MGKLSGSNLSAECERKNKSWMKTSVDLSTCVTNNNGNLQKGGAYDRSCSGCKLSSSTLSCSCRKRDGNNKNTSFNLNSFIANDDGVFSGCGRATSSPIEEQGKNTDTGSLGNGSGSSSSSSSSTTNPPVNDPSSQKMERNANAKFRKARKHR